MILKSNCYPAQEWDEDLAYLAQFWASACEYAENEDRNTQSTSYDYIGESLAATISYTVNYTQLIGQLWYAEKRFYSYYVAACLNEDGEVEDDGGYETCGRYTQVSITTHHRVDSNPFYRWCGPGRMLLAVELSDVLN